MELRKRGRLGRPLDRDSFLKAIAQFPPSIFHAKGIFEFSDDPQGGAKDTLTVSRGIEGTIFELAFGDDLTLYLGRKKPWG